MAAFRIVLQHQEQWIRQWTNICPVGIGNPARLWHNWCVDADQKKNQHQTPNIGWATHIWWCPQTKNRFRGFLILCGERHCESKSSSGNGSAVSRRCRIKKKSPSNSQYWLFGDYFVIWCDDDDERDDSNYHNRVCSVSWLAAQK